MFDMIRQVLLYIVEIATTMLELFGIWVIFSKCTI